MLIQKSGLDPLQIHLYEWFQVRFLNQHCCTLVDLEGLELRFFSENFTSSGGIVTAQHTRKSASPDQISSQERPKCKIFVAKLTRLYKSVYALRIPTLYLGTPPPSDQNPVKQRGGFLDRVNWIKSGPFWDHFLSDFPLGIDILGP